MKKTIKSQTIFSLLICSLIAVSGSVQAGGPTTTSSQDFQNLGSPIFRDLGERFRAVETAYINTPSDETKNAYLNARKEVLHAAEAHSKATASSVPVSN